jgi:uncharacterized protein involved in high-affinity Fe2+ transport
MGATRWGIGLAGFLLAAGTAGMASAKEFYVGEPVVQDGMKIVPNYLTGVRTTADRSHMMLPLDMIHLEADVHATRDESHGFPQGAWIPYLRIEYRLTHAGSRFVRAGTLRPMVAKDGPHYADNVLMDGEGTYHLTFVIFPPPEERFPRHVDAATGVPEWWKPLKLNWIFTYPSKPN